MAYPHTQSAECSWANETRQAKENGLADREGKTPTDLDMRLGLCGYEQIMKEITAYRESASPSKENSETHVSESRQAADTETGASEGRIELPIDPESAKIYEQADVELGKCEKEALADQKYEVYKLKEIDPALECPDGRTNTERMAQGLAPYVVRDGKLIKVELHHHGQNGNGPLVELGSDAHKEQDAALHPGNGKGEGRGFDPLWDQKRSEHWQLRAKEI